MPGGALGSGSQGSRDRTSVAPRPSWTFSQRYRRGGRWRFLAGYRERRTSDWIISNARMHEKTAILSSEFMGEFTRSRSRGATIERKGSQKIERRPAKS